MEPVAVLWSTDRSALEQDIGRTNRAKAQFGDSSPSRVATDNCDKITLERPHPSLANGRSRPFSDIQLPELLAAEQSLARRLAVIGSSRVS